MKKTINGGGLYQALDPDDVKIGLLSGLESYDSKSESKKRIKSASKDQRHCGFDLRKSHLKDDDNMSTSVSSTTSKKKGRGFKKIDEVIIRKDGKVSVRSCPTLSVVHRQGVTDKQSRKPDVIRKCFQSFTKIQQRFDDDISLNSISDKQMQTMLDEQQNRLQSLMSNEKIIETRQQCKSIITHADPNPKGQGQLQPPVKHQIESQDLGYLDFESQKYRDDRRDVYLDRSHHSSFEEFIGLIGVSTSTSIASSPQNVHETVSSPQHTASNKESSFNHSVFDFDIDKNFQDMNLESSQKKSISNNEYNDNVRSITNSRLDDEKALLLWKSQKLLSASENLNNSYNCDDEGKYLNPTTIAAKASVTTTNEEHKTISITTTPSISSQTDAGSSITSVTPSSPKKIKWWDDSLNNSSCDIGNESQSKIENDVCCFFRIMNNIFTLDSGEEYYFYDDDYDDYDDDTYIDDDDTYIDDDYDDDEYKSNNIRDGISKHHSNKGDEKKISNGGERNKGQREKKKKGWPRKIWRR